MAETVMDYARVTGRFGKVVADRGSQGADAFPDTIRPDRGAVVTFTPVRDWAQVVGTTAGDEAEWKELDPITATIDAEGYLVGPGGLREVWLPDLHSIKVAGRIPLDVESWIMAISKLAYGGVSRIVKARGFAPTGLDNDVTRKIPAVKDYRGQAITQGPAGDSVVSARRVGTTMVLTTRDAAGGTADLDPVELVAGDSGQDGRDGDSVIAARRVGTAMVLSTTDAEGDVVDLEPVELIPGRDGRDGLDATDAAEDDAAVAGFLTTAGTQSRAALEAAVDDAAGDLTFTSADVTDFTEAAQDAIAAMLVSGGNITLAYDDANDRLTVTAAGADAEVVRDTIGAALVGTSGVTVGINDAADTITLSISSVTIAQVTNLQAALDGKVSASVLTAKGDSLTRTSSAVVREPVGADGTVLTADSTATTGRRWAVPTSSGTPTGAGSPEGVRTASPGAMFIQTDAVALGNILVWRKQTGTSNTGWVIVEGDTGWRDVTALASTTAGTLALRRTINHVFWRFSSANHATGGAFFASSNSPANSVPGGFQVVKTQITLPGVLSGDRVVFVVAEGTILRRTFHIASSGSGSTNAAACDGLGQAGLTADAWPASLPGTATT